MAVNSAVSKAKDRSQDYDIIGEEVAQNEGNTADEKSEPNFQAPVSVDQPMPSSQQVSLVYHLGFKPHCAVHAIQAWRASLPNNGPQTYSSIIRFLEHSIFFSADSNTLRGTLRPSFLARPLQPFKFSTTYKNSSLPNDLSEALSFSVPTFVAGWQMEASKILGLDLHSLAVAILQVIPKGKIHLPDWMLQEATSQPYPTIEQLLLLVSTNSRMVPHLKISDTKVYVSLQHESPPRKVSTSGSYTPRMPSLAPCQWHCPTQDMIPTPLHASSLSELGAQVVKVIGLEWTTTFEESLFFEGYLVVNGLKRAVFAALRDIIHEAAPCARHIMFLEQEYKWKIVMEALPPPLQYDCFVLDTEGQYMKWTPRRLNVCSSGCY